MALKSTAAAALISGLLLAACSGGNGGGSGGGTLKASELQGAWPFTVNELKLECTDDLAIYAVAGDKVYPLNGEAERLRKAPGDKPVTRLEEIQKDDPEASKFVPGAKMPMDSVRSAAIASCQKAGKWLKAES